MNHYRVAVLTKRKTSRSSKQVFVRGDDDLIETVREKLDAPGLIFLAVRPLSEAAYVRATRSD